MRREIRIVVETERTIEVSGDEIDNNWCHACRDYTTLIPVEVAAEIASVGAGAIYHWISNADFHCKTGRGGLPRICQRSFLEHLERLNFLPKLRSGASPD